MTVVLILFVCNNQVKVESTVFKEAVVTYQQVIEKCSLSTSDRTYHVFSFVYESLDRNSRVRT